MPSSSLHRTPMLDQYFGKSLTSLDPFQNGLDSLGIQISTVEHSFPSNKGPPPGTSFTHFARRELLLNGSADFNGTSRQELLKRTENSTSRRLVWAVGRRGLLPCALLPTPGIRTQSHTCPHLTHTHPRVRPGQLYPGLRAHKAEQPEYACVSQ